MKLLLSYITILITFQQIFAQGTSYFEQREAELLSIARSSDTLSENDAVTAYFALADLYIANDQARAFAYIDSAEKYMFAHGRYAERARLYTKRGMLYARLGNYLKAVRQYQKSISYYNKYPGLNYMSGYLHVNIGNIFYQLKQYSEAENFYKDALQIFKNTTEPSEGYGEAVALNNIALCEIKLGRHDSALYNFKKALTYRVKLDDPELIAHSLVYISQVHFLQNKLDKADSVISYGLNVLQADPNSNWYKNLELQQAILQYKTGNIDLARKNLEKTEDYYEEHPEIFFHTEIYHTLAELEMAEGNLSKASYYSAKGYQAALDRHDYLDAIDFEIIRKDIAVKRNNLKSALEHSGNIVALKDSFININEVVMQELLGLNASIRETQKKNEQLQSTTDNYSNTINNQKWLLFGASFLILALLSLFYFIVRLNKKLKHNQSSQRELNQRVLAVINNTDSIIVSLNYNGDIRIFNDSALKFFKKWQGVEFTAGDNLLEKLPDPHARRIWMDSIAKSQNVEHWKEVSKVLIDHKSHYFLENFSTITHSDGTYAGLVMVANDITKEQEFNVKMSEQKDMLERGNQAKERMLSILAHDLKDAIYSACSLSELVMESPDDFPREELLHLFTLLYGNFDKTRNLLDGLLDWMKTQTGGMEANKEVFNIKDLSWEVIEAFETRSLSKQIKLMLEIPDNTLVVGDREMIKTVIRNLVNNALKYTKSKEGEVCIFTDPGEDQNLVIHVKDNGQGISEANQHKLFHTPGRFSTPGTANEQGTGFGLSLCKELIQMNGSHLQLKSKEGSGSDFYFSLPLVNKKEGIPAHLSLN